MAIDINLGLSAEATGTVDVITATYSPAPTLVDRKILFLRTLGTNLTTTPTFNPNGLGALTIVKQGGVALAVGDLKGDVILMYNLANTQWELINPLVPIVTGTNTGDETAARIGTIVNAATDLPTPLDADKVGIWDSLNSLYKAVTWANIKVTLKAYFDTVYKATFSENTAFNKNFGTTTGTVLAGDAARYMTIPFSTINLTPLDSTTYYVGRTALLIPPSTTETDNSFKIGFASTVVAVHFETSKPSASVTGSAENWTLKIRNITTATSSSSYGNFTSDVVSSTSKIFYLTGATAIVSATDDIAIEVTSPVLATNPTNMRFSGWILIKLD